MARLLSSKSDTLIMLSATPHDGKKRSFASLMNMLNPTSIANPDDIRGLFIRRFKKDIKEQVAMSRKSLQASADKQHETIPKGDRIVFRTVVNYRNTCDKHLDNGGDPSPGGAPYHPTGKRGNQ